MVATESARLGGGFWRWWSAATAANIADGIRAGAFPLLAAALTRNPLGVAAVAAAQHGAWLLFGLFAGAVADRHPPARVVLLADLVRVAALAVLLAGVLAGAVGIALLVVAAFAIGVAETFRDTSAPSLLPRLVPKALLERANGRLVGSEVVGNEFLGPLLGAVLFATAMALPIAGDGFALALAVAFVLSLPRSVRTATASAPPVRGRLGSDLVAGITWLAGHRLLRTVVAAGALLALADSVWWTVLVLYVTVVLHLPAAAYGLLLATGAAGGAVGALLAERCAARWRTVPLLAGSALAAGLPAAGFVVPPPPWAAFVLLAVSSGGFAVWNVVALSARQRAAPAELLGRVTSANRVLVYGGATLGALTGGWLAGALSLRAPFAAGALLTATAAILLLTARRA